MQPQPAFDTYAFVKRLTHAGMSEDQAEVLANGQADLYERLVTKEYFEFTLSHELEKLRAELKHDIAKVQANLEQIKAELKHELDQHKAANKQALKELELTLKHEHETTKTELKRDIREMEQKLTMSSARSWLSASPFYRCSTNSSERLVCCVTMPGSGHVNAEEIILASLIASETEIPVFNTEGSIKRLTDAGMPEAQAGIGAEQQARVHKRCH